MQLRIDTYNGFIIKVLFPFWVITLLSIFGMSICFVIIPNEMNDCIFLLVSFVVSFVVISMVIVTIRFMKPRTWYLFDNEKMQICHKKGNKEEIYIQDVEFIHYRPFKIRYLVTIFFGELNECGAWRIYIKFKDGRSKIIGFFDIKSVEALRNLYGEMIIIY